MYDVLFLGSGHGAWNAAVPLGKAGLKVAVVEEDRFGGVCTNRGCNAKITLDKPVELVHTIEQLQGRGFDTVPKINWPDLMAHKHEVIDGLADGIRQRLVAAGVKVIEGHGTFKDVRTIQVGERTLTAKKIVIVSGQRPHQLEISGKELTHNSTDFLVIPEMPAHVTLIGAGYVAMEIASIANAAGAKVDVVLRGHQPLREFYQPYVQRLINNMRNRGIKFYYDETITAVVKKGTQLELQGTAGFSLQSDYIVDATGRVPNVEKLNLAAAGIDYNENGVVVNDHLETSAADVYATGDVVAKKLPKITPTAIFEAQYLVALFTQKTEAAINYPPIATTVFTSPRVAQAGISPTIAKKQPEDYSVEVVDYENDWFHQVQNETDGSLTLVFDRKTDRLVGATEYSNEAVDTINGLLDYMELGVTKAQLQRLIYIFPSTQHSYMRKI
ncbi:dihydrolipoyl dehydrogenase family protein [Loigolactobacillus iwatensis]|uniref:dihydrolipoyl dehydrogenase family protein n=1 Tax=Loigolactobacillus iwatensis TaxID=1267156 RepID=UPI000F7DD128|nr:NAD(P)/FAD-dependent oxidoreductase [Loigolactobacillus iwatensis]